LSDWAGSGSVGCTGVAAGAGGTATGCVLVVVVGACATGAGATEFSGVGVLVLSPRSERRPSRFVLSPF